MKRPSDNENKEDSLVELQEMAQRLLDFDKDLTTVERRKNYDTYLEYFSDLENFAWDKGYRLKIPEITGDKLEDISVLVIFCSNLSEVLEKEKPLRKFGMEHKAHEIRTSKRQLINKMEFNDRFFLQMLVNEARDILETSEYFSENHQLRLLKRLEKFQVALHGSHSFFEYIFNEL